MSKQIIVSVLLLAITWGCDAIYRYNTNCLETKTCATNDGWHFSRATCGCVKDGDSGHKSSVLPHLGLHNWQQGPIVIQNPFTIPNQDPNIIFQGSQPQIIVPQPPPQIIQSPGGPPILIRNPSPQIIQQPPGQVLVPPRCPRTFICAVNQFFDENQCRCVCATQQSCSPGQRFDSVGCQCVCAIITSCPRSFQTFNPVTCQCEPQTCLGRCSQCERQDPNTCACEPIAGFCPFGQVLNPSTCQCSCGFVQCNGRSQRLNPQTCQCQCTSFTATITEQIPGPPGPPIAVPGTVSTRTGTGTRSTRRTGKKRRHVEEEQENEINDDAAAIEGPEAEEVLFREKRRRRRRPGSRTRPGPRTRIISPPTFIPGPPGPPTTVSRTVQVATCPPGTAPNEFTCSCF